ncbi:MAG: GlsB/YeaQ/YmgE family stress response membrane protein [Tissierellia bacterium]|nr:GlsB/YeaQ/YmgE family stress response membrane protein [Tissierellia bacterium]
MGILYALIIGGLAGWIASLIMKTDHKMGLLANIIAGIVGGALGGWILGLLKIKPEGAWYYDLLVGVFGAVVLIAIINAIMKRK